MGQKLSNKKTKENSKVPLTDKIEIMLFDTYQNTEIDFSYKEVLTIKLRVADAEKYFLRSNFDYLIYFNSYIFQQRLNILYDNFSNIVEKFVKNHLTQLTTNFMMLVDFDDESIGINDLALNPYQYYLDNEGNIVMDTQNYQNNVQYNKIEYESLFTIIFEPLEIKTILFFLMTNHNQNSINDFFSQLYENIYLYKNNRKYDSLYFLLPNLDFLIRNESYVLYIVNQPNQFDESLDMLSDYTISYVNSYTDSIFTSLYFKELLNVNYNKENIEGNFLINYFVCNIIQPTFIKSIFKFDISFPEVDNFILKYEREFEMFELLSENSNVNMIIIKLINKVNEENISHMIKKLVNIVDKCKYNKSVMIIRFFYLNMTKETSDAQKDGEKFSNKIKELVGSLIKDSFIFGARERVRKIVIEYYDSYYVDIENANLNDSNENINLKLNTHIHFFKWKLYYCYFLTKKHIFKMKRYIYNILLGKISDKKCFENIFNMLFTQKYFLWNLSYEEGKLNHQGFDKLIYL